MPCLSRGGRLVTRGSVGMPSLGRLQPSHKNMEPEAHASVGLRSVSPQGGTVRTLLFHTSFQDLLFSVGDTCSSLLPWKGERTVSVVCGKPLSLKAAQP